MPVTRKPVAPASKPGPRAVPGKPQAKPQGEQYASLNPEDWTSGGGLLDDVDVLILSCRFAEWDYNGSIAQPVFALKVDMQYDDGGKEAVVEQYLSAGDLTRFIPSADGSHAVSAAGAKGLNLNTNAALFLKSAIDQGVPVEQFGDGDVSILEGMFCHINRVPQPQRGGRIQTKNQAGYDLTVPVITKIHRMPWESEQPKTAPSRPTGRTATAASARPAVAHGTVGRTAPIATPAPVNGEADLESVAAEIITEVLGEKNGSVSKGSLPPACFKKLAGNGNRSALLGLITSDDFLWRGDEYGWAYDGKTISAV